MVYLIVFSLFKGMLLNLKVYNLMFLFGGNLFVYGKGRVIIFYVMYIIKVDIVYLVIYK